MPGKGRGKEGEEDRSCGGDCIKKKQKEWEKIGEKSNMYI